MLASARVLTTLSAPGSSHKAAPGLNRCPPLLVCGQCALQPPPLFLSPGLFSGPAWVGFFLKSQACTGTQTRRHTGGDPPASAHCSQFPAGRTVPWKPAPPGLAVQSAALPVLLTKAGSSGLEPAGFRSSVPPNPHEILGLIPRCRRPSVLWQVGQSPTTRAKVSSNTHRERVKGELGHSNKMIACKRLAGLKAPLSGLYH